MAATTSRSRARGEFRGGSPRRRRRLARRRRARAGPQPWFRRRASLRRRPVTGVRDGARDEIGEDVGAPRGGDGGGEVREVRTERGGAVGAAEEGEHLRGHRRGVEGVIAETLRSRLGAEHRRAEHANLQSLAARAEDRARDDPPRSGGLRRAEVGIRRDQRRVVGGTPARARPRARRAPPSRHVSRARRPARPPKGGAGGLTTPTRSSRPKTFVRRGRVCKI